MRNLITFIAILTINCTTLMANNTASNHPVRCETPCLTHEASNLIEKVKTDLLSGYWTNEQNQEKKNIIWFDAHGALNSINYSKGVELDFEVKTWSLDANLGVAILEINNQAYEVQSIENGIKLVHPIGYKSINLTFNKQLPINAQTIEGMVGDWSCVGMEKGRFAELNFNADGSVNKTYGTREATLSIDGTYALSADGEFVVLSFGDEQYAAKICYMAYGELVLEQKANNGQVQAMTFMR